jgi:signal transduction histidine kinase
MTNGRAQDLSWHRVLEICAHEIRNPLTPLLGYLRMLLGSNRFGELTEQQRHMLVEMEKVSGKFSRLLVDLEQLEKLESGYVQFNRVPVDVGALIEQSIASLPPPNDRETPVVAENHAPGSSTHGDPKYLKIALDALFFVLRREVIPNTHLQVRLRRVVADQAPCLWLALAGNEHVDAVDATPLAEAGPFDLKRGGCGLKPPIAEWIIAAHGGRVLAPLAYPKSAALILLPEARSGS